MNESYSIWLAQTPSTPVTQSATPAAPAQPTQTSTTSPGTNSPSTSAPQSSLFQPQLVILIIAMVFMFWWMSHKQKKEREARQKLIDSVKTGDKVVTTAGIHGVVSNVKEKTLIVKIAENVKIEMNRSAVEVVEPKSGGEEAVVKEIPTKK